VALCMIINCHNGMRALTCVVDHSGCGDGVKREYL